MKIKCVVGESRANRNVCFSYQHMFLPMKKYADCYESNVIEEGTTHMVFIDVIQNVRILKNIVLDAKSKGIKIIAVTFDPANFEEADRCIEEGLLDMLVLTDMQFKDRFPNTNVYVSDYFLNEDLFSKLETKKDSDVCYFGHLIGNYKRNNEHNLPVIVDFNSYEGLYSKVQNFNGCFIYDTGRGEDPNEVIHHNKAKAIEALMCGVNAYCQDGIKTKNYDHLLFKENDLLSPKKINFSQEEVFQINENVIKEFLNECENC